MGKLYSVADEQVQGLLQEAIGRWHEDLKEVGAYVLAILVDSEDDEKPALARGGYPLLACVSVVSTADRVTKQHDAEIHINAAEWGMMSNAQRLALLDHELSHLSVKCRKQKKSYTGPKVFERDQHGRPELRLRNGDWNVGDGFKEVVERHGEAASELTNIRRAYAFTMQIVEGAEQ